MAETLSARTVLRDVSASLPRHPTKVYGRRNPAAISKIIVHHSAGATSPGGYAGAVRTGEFFVRPDAPAPGLQGRDWAGFAYTYWIPYSPTRDLLGRNEIYRCQPDDVVSNHTGGAANGNGVAICLQGSFAGPHNDAPNADGPSAPQLAALEDLVAYLQERHPGATVSGHEQHGKPACPGGWFASWRAGAAPQQRSVGFEVPPVALEVALVVVVTALGLVVLL